MKDHIISIAIADDDKLISRLLSDFLNDSGKYDILFTASDGEELIFKLDESTTKLPEILLLDLRMKGTNGIDSIQYLKVNYPEIKIIVISSYYQESFMGFLFKTGAAAFVPKEISPESLKHIINTVYHQGIYFSEEQVTKLRLQISSRTPKPALDDETELSKREIEVLNLICQQKTAKEIGELLFISTKTVEGHRNSLFVKTGVKNVVGLVIYALQHNLIEVENLPPIGTYDGRL